MSVKKNIHKVFVTLMSLAVQNKIFIRHTGSNQTDRQTDIK